MTEREENSEATGATNGEVGTPAAAAQASAAVVIGWLERHPASLFLIGMYFLVAGLTGSAVGFGPWLPAEGMGRPVVALAGLSLTLPGALALIAMHLSGRTRSSAMGVTFFIAACIVTLTLISAFTDESPPGHLAKDVRALANHRCEITILPKSIPGDEDIAILLVFHKKPEEGDPLRTRDFRAQLFPVDAGPRFVMKVDENIKYGDAVIGHAYCVPKGTSISEVTGTGMTVRDISNRFFGNGIGGPFLPSLTDDAAWKEVFRERIRSYPDFELDPDDLASAYNRLDINRRARFRAKTDLTK